VRILRETWLLLTVSLRSLRQRLDVALVATAGFAGVVLVLVSVLSMAAGFRRTLGATGSPDVAIVLRKGSGAELSSTLTLAQARRVGDAPGVAVGAHGPEISPELLVLLNRRERGSRTLANVPFRGVTAEAFRVHPHVHLVAGHLFTPGLDQVIVGRSAARTFQGLGLGERFTSGGVRWHVVGIFGDRGGVHSSEIWTDLPSLESAYRRGDSVSAVYARLTSPAAYPRFRSSLEHNPELSVSVHRENRYYARQARGLSRFITIAGTVIALMMGLGALFAAANTMYATVSERVREVAILRTLGYDTAAVVLSVVAESVLYAVLGGILGALAAYAAFNGFEASTLSNFSVVVFRFAVTPALALQGILFAAVLGLAAGLAPAWTAGRRPIAEGVRAL
jgi:putative ABC transport system permease protein